MQARLQMHRFWRQSYFAVLILCAAMLGCESKINSVTGDDMEFRTIAWNYITEPEKATVTGDWRTAKVQTTQWNDKTAVSVTFNTTDDALLGPIVIMIDPPTKKVVQQLPRF
ncbi:hypothetical protein L0337_29650 [candidate division KSB1 bacterium]|nr:hypothetical protein [candidate division KSB1 bacterium]